MQESQWPKDFVHYSAQNHTLSVSYQLENKRDMLPFTVCFLIHRVFPYTHRH